MSFRRKFMRAWARERGMEWSAKKARARERKRAEIAVARMDHEARVAEERERSRYQRPRRGILGKVADAFRRMIPSARRTG